MNPPSSAAEPARDPLLLVLERLERIEARLDRWEATLGHVPAVVATATDMADELARQVAHSGPDVDTRMQATVRVLEHASRPDTADAVNRLLARMDDLEHALGSIAQLPHAAATVVDIFDRTLMDWQGMGYSADARLTALRDLLLTATSPEILRAAQQLAEHLPVLAKVIPDAQQLPGLFAIVVDVFDRWAAQLAEDGSSIEQMGRNLGLALTRLGVILDSPEFVALMNSGVLAPNALAVVGQVGGVLSESNSDGADNVGLFSLLKTLREPSVRAAVAFALNTLRAFGQRLDSPSDSSSRAKGA